MWRNQLSNISYRENEAKMKKSVARRGVAKAAWRRKRGAALGGRESEETEKAAYRRNAA
jgi:hypothetical protein